MRDYDAIVLLMKRQHDVRIRKWRSRMSGCAWQVRYRDGSVIRWIEAPRPRTPISLSIFLHEVGHHVIGFDSYRRRCEEEYHAWRWAMEQMHQLGVPPDDRVLRRYELSMRYAVSKALRRGIREIPDPLQRFLPQAA